MLHHLAMPILSASPSMVNVENLMKETFNNNSLALGLGLANNNHLLGGGGAGLPEDEYINQLIAAVEKRPVLYNVNLLDYKNKNKKGEAFKEVQQVMRAAGCNEQQVQGTYKKWISLKRKFRVEYFKPRSEDSREACCTFPYFDSLRFLVPYCEAYKICKSASKRKAADDLSGMLKMDEDESDDETYGNYDEDTSGTQSALEMLFSQKRAKLDHLMSAAANGMVHLSNSNGSEVGDSPPPAASRSPTIFARQTAASPLPNSNSSGSSRRSTSNTTANGTAAATSASNSSASPASVLNSLPSLFGAQSGDELQSAMAAAAAAYLNPLPQDDSPNSLFGRLVANEIDKLPPGMHNVVRAQVLLLLAQASSSTPSTVVSATDRILSCLTP
ncbi:hypothetical protein M3Y99_00041000 [Aphelenchoides fujianensis]|nr:hypothetical protein M3Y99_00041000 [Aphelenchoides fujianensis]